LVLLVVRWRKETFEQMTKRAKDPMSEAVDKILDEYNLGRLSKVQLEICLKPISVAMREQKIINSATEAIKDRCGGDMPGDMSAAIQTELARNQSERVRAGVLELLRVLHKFGRLDDVLLYMISASFNVDADEICGENGITWRA